jgi:hypothetical protein
MSDHFAGLQIYYVPTEADIDIVESLPEGGEREQIRNVTKHRSVRYVLGRSGNQVFWVLDGPHYADREHGQYEVESTNVCDFFELMKARCMKVVLGKRRLVPDSVLAGIQGHCSVDETKVLI